MTGSGDRWLPIATAPIHKTVIVAKRGERFRVAAKRHSIEGKWWHTHSGDAVCFEPDCWTPLPPPPVSP